MQETRIPKKVPLPSREATRDGPRAGWRPNVGGTIKRGRTPELWQVDLESELPDGWSVRGVCTFHDGRVRLRDATFIPPAGKDTIGDLKEAMRRLRLSWVAREWEYLLARARWAELPEEWRSGIRESPRPGRAGHPPAFYAEWVERYLEACSTSEAPMAWLVEHHPGESSQSINRYLKKAEGDGLIERAGRGKAGGTKTEKCDRVLAGEED